jgi:PAS domain S-box-containing protein
LGDDPSKLQIKGISWPVKLLSMAEKATGLKLADFRLDLDRSETYSQVIREGKTIGEVSIGEVIAQVVPRPAALAATKILGAANKMHILTPLRRQGKIIGLIGMDSTTLGEYLILSVKNLAQHISGALDLAAEISRRRLAEDELWSERRLLRTLIDNMPDYIYVKDPESRFLTTNSAHLEALGVESVGAIFGKTDFDFFSAELAQRYYEDEQEVIKKRRPLIGREEPVVDKAGNTRWFLTTKVPVLGAGGGVIGIVGISRDITQRRRAEEDLHAHTEKLEELVRERTKELKEKQRLATIGETTTMVGHDLRNPLQAILNNLYLAKKNLASSDFDNKDALAERFSIIERETGYMNKIVSDLQDFARPVMPKRYATDMGRLMGELLSSLNIPDSVEVDAQFAPDFPLIMVDADLMKRALTNLFTNAIQAMPKGGRLVLGLKVEGHDAAITVGDTGVGIPKDNLGKLFEPLFTTRSQGQGFGLSVCRRLVGAHGGTIKVQSELGKGSTFTILVPMTPREPDEQAAG